MSSISPCMNCEDRYCGCHSDCERYVLYAKERRDETKRLKEARSCEAKLTEHSCRLSLRCKQNVGKSKIFRSPKK